MQYSDKVMEHFMHPRNVGEIKDADGIGKVGNPVCVLKDTLVNVDCGVKNINCIGKDRNVLSHDGKYNSVSRIFSRNYSGKIYSIGVQNLGNLAITPEHHIRALKMGHLDRRYSVYKNYIPDWYSASELRKGDVILYPIPLECQNANFMKFDVEIPQNDFKSKRMPGKVAISDDFLRLVGFYLSEGYVRTDKCKGTLGFTFGGHEMNYCNEVIRCVKDIFNIEPAPLVKKNNSINISFYSARLARFYEKHFGKGAAKKHLPHFMILLSPDKQKHIIETLWKGDGYFCRNNAKYCTISKQLAAQLKLLLMRQRIVFSYLTIPAKGMHKENYHIYVRSIPSLKKLGRILGQNYKHRQKEKNSLKAWYDDRYFYTQIKSITNKKFKGKVYNLEVKGAHSYTTQSACLHNCGDIMNLYIKVENDVITDAKFKTFGCGAAIATSSMVTELIKGKTISEALKLSNKAVATALGGLPKVKMHCSVLAEQALKAALDDYEKKKKAENDK